MYYNTCLQCVLNNSLCESRTVEHIVKALEYDIYKCHLLIALYPHFPGHAAQRIAGRGITKASLETDPYDLDILYKPSVNTTAPLSK